MNIKKWDFNDYIHFNLILLIIIYIIFWNNPIVVKSPPIIANNCIIRYVKLWYLIVYSNVNGEKLYLKYN